MNATGCERLRELGAELALGVLPALERAEALAHLDGCPACRDHVEALTRTTDALLTLLPGTEPPLGFETRTVSRLLPGGAPAPAAHPAAPETGPAGAGGKGLARGGTGAAVGGEGWAGGGRGAWAGAGPGAQVAGGAEGRAAVRPREGGWLRWRPRLVAAAAALALVCGFGGWAVGTAVERAAAPPAQTRAGAPLLQAALRAGGHEVGRIFAYPGTPGWVYMSLDLEGGAAGGGVRCVLTRADGSTVAVGSFTLRGGYGSWGAPAPVDPSTLTGAQVLAPDGTVLATARFPAPPA